MRPLLETALLLIAALLYIYVGWRKRIEYKRLERRVERNLRAMSGGR